MKKKAGAKSTDPKDINTSAIINKSRVFRDVTLDLSKCRAAMIAILQATAIGVQFTDKEQTELFFSLTQLMHNQDPYIHRLLILLLKQIKIKPHDAIIITHSLSKDINGEVAMTQGHAIRCLCSLLDANSALTLEKFLKPAISSNNPYTSSSALCGALKIIEGGRKDAVLRWLYEIRQASNSTQRSVRFHALLLLHALRSDDLHASAQLSSTLEPSKSILEQCIQISIATQTLKLKQTDQVMNFLRQSINSNSPQTCLETIRKCGSYLPNESATAISSFFGGSILRSFAAVRTIANSTNIQVYSSLLPQIIELTKHSNSSLAALASICVLRLGDESHMDIATKRILKNCKKWATPLLKSVAQEACVFAGKYKSDKLTDVAVLLLKYTNDKKSKFSILRSLLTTEGIPRSQLLPKLSEYLEDWDTVDVARTICDFIGGQVESLEDPEGIIPVLFNRVNLDVSSVRMAALNTLSCIAYKCEGMKEKILPLLSLFVDDEDDIVREHVLLLIHALKSCLDMSTILTEFHMVSDETDDISHDEHVSDNSEQTTDLQQVTDETTFIPVEFDDNIKRKYGDIIRKTDAIDLTDRDEEFVVSYFVNIFKKHIILEFIVTNTIEDKVYNDLSIRLSDIDVLDDSNEYVAKQVGYQQTVSTCLVLERSQSHLCFGTFSAKLEYTDSDVGSEDEYNLGDVYLGPEFWCEPISVDFEREWDNEQYIKCTKAFVMSNDKDTESAVKRIEDDFSWLHFVCKGENSKNTAIILDFSGQMIDNGPFVLVRTEVGSSKSKGIICRVTVKTSSNDLCQKLIHSFFR